MCLIFLTLHPDVMSRRLGRLADSILIFLLILATFRCEAVFFYGRKMEKYLQTWAGFTRRVATGGKTLRRRLYISYNLNLMLCSFLAYSRDVDRVNLTRLMLNHPKVVRKQVLVIHPSIDQSSIRRTHSF